LRSAPNLSTMNSADSCRVLHLWPYPANRNYSMKRSASTRFCAILVAFVSPLAAHSADPAPVEFFEKHVRPLLVEHCHKCHGDKKPKGGLSLTSRAGLLKGGDSGPAVAPGQLDKSLLIKAVRYLD